LDKGSSVPVSDDKSDPFNLTAGHCTRVDADGDIHSSSSNVR